MPFCINVQKSSSAVLFVQAFGLAEETLDHYLTGGIMVWGPPVRAVLDDGDLLIQQARSPDTRGLVSVLIEGQLRH